MGVIYRFLAYIVHLSSLALPAYIVYVGARATVWRGFSGMLMYGGVALGCYALLGFVSRELQRRGERV